MALLLARTRCKIGAPHTLFRHVRSVERRYSDAKGEKIWEPTNPSAAPLDHYRRFVNAKYNTNLQNEPMSPDQYRWFYSAFPSHVQLTSVAGGTDIASSWFTTDPTGPVYTGEMQMKALGMDVDVADPETGESVEKTGSPGELICRTAFPSMPVCFWGDPSHKKYISTYFSQFPSVPRPVWSQADWVSINPRTGGATIHGRSDGILNPSGVRFGSAEIYAITESPPFRALIRDSLCVGQRRPGDADERVLLFVKMQQGQTLDEELRGRLEGAIRSALSPKHVPARTLQVEEIPVTKNGKKLETAVKALVSGREVRASEAVADVEVLEGYKRFVDLE